MVLGIFRYESLLMPATNFAREDKILVALAREDKILIVMAYIKEL